MRKEYVALVILLAIGSSIGINHTVQEKQKPREHKASKLIDPEKKIAEPLSPEFNRSETNRISIREDAQKLRVEEIEPSIAAIESQLEERNAIERLNQDLTSPEERSKYNELFIKRDQLRKQQLVLRLAEIDEQVSDLERKHASRLDAYGIKKP